MGESLGHGSKEAIGGVSAQIGNDEDGNEAHGELYECWAPDGIKGYCSPVELIDVLLSTVLPHSVDGATGVIHEGT